MTTRTVAGAMLVLFAGCAIYSEPGHDTPSAELMLSSNLADDPFATGGTGWNQNDFYAFADEGCTAALGGLAFFQMHDGSRKTVRVAAGKRIYIRASWMNKQPMGAGQEVYRSCFNLVSFVPEANETYELEQDILREPGPIGVRPQCRAVVHAVGVYGPAKSFQEHEFHGQCAAQIKGV